MTQPVASTKQGGRAASVGVVEPADLQQAMNLAINWAAEVFDEPGELEQLEKLRSLTPQLENEVEAQIDFIGALRKMLDPDGSKADMQSSDDASDKPIFIATLWAAASWLFFRPRRAYEPATGFELAVAISRLIRARVSGKGRPLLGAT
jgi:hypothetical protein